MSIEPESAAWSRLDAAWRDRARTQQEAYARVQGRLRAEQRESAPRVELTLDALIDVIADRVAPGLSLGPTRRREYAEHLVQSYCECEVDRGWRDDPGGWEVCAHARDDGF